MFQDYSEYDYDDDVEVPEVPKGPARKAKVEKRLKYEVTDTEGDKWQEYLTHAEVSDYHRKKYTLSRVYFWQVWR